MIYKFVYDGGSLKKLKKGLSKTAMAISFILSLLVSTCMIMQFTGYVDRYTHYTSSEDSIYVMLKMSIFFILVITYWIFYFKVFFNNYYRDMENVYERNKEYVVIIKESHLVISSDIIERNIYFEEIIEVKYSKSYILLKTNDSSRVILANGNNFSKFKRCLANKIKHNIS